MTSSRGAAMRGAVVFRVAALLAVAAVALALPIAGSAAGPDAVSIVDKTFVPPDITVHVRDTVTWTVTQAIAEPHSVTSGTDSSDPNNAKLFDSGINLRNNGDHFSYTFTSAGTFPYYCQVHPTVMKGTITVLGPGGGGASPSAAAPSAAPASGAPASRAPASGAPAASGPAASPTAGVPGEEKAPVPVENKVAAAVILGVVLLLLFGAAIVYRRVNR
jgi:plastocyanin